MTCSCISDSADSSYLPKQRNNAVPTAVKTVIFCLRARCLFLRDRAPLSCLKKKEKEKRLRFVTAQFVRDSCRRLLASGLFKLSSPKREKQAFHLVVVISYPQQIFCKYSRPSRVGESPSFWPSFKIIVSVRKPLHVSHCDLIWRAKKKKMAD